MGKYKAIIGTRNGTKADDVLFTKTFEIDAVSVQSAKSQTMIWARLERGIIKTGWRDWTDTHPVDESLNPITSQWVASRDTLCNAMMQQSFVHLFWEDNDDES